MTETRNNLIALCNTLDAEKQETKDALKALHEEVENLNSRLIDLEWYDLDAMKDCADDWSYWTPSEFITEDSLDEALDNAIDDKDLVRGYQLEDCIRDKMQELDLCDLEQFDELRGVVDGLQESLLNEFDRILDLTDRIQNLENDASQKGYIKSLERRMEALEAQNEKLTRALSSMAHYFIKSIK